MASNGEDPHSLKQWRWGRRKIPGGNLVGGKRDFRDQEKRELGK